MSQELWLQGLSGILALLGSLVIVVWSMLRAESKAQAESIAELARTKADTERMFEAEHRLDREIQSAKNENTRILDKLESRMDRDLRAVEVRFLERVDSLESNLTRQNDMIIELIKKGR